MDPREIIVLSSDDEMSIEPYRTPSDESNGRNRAFSGPVEMSLGSDDLHGGKDSSFRLLSCFHILFIMLIKNGTPPSHRRS